MSKEFNITGVCVPHLHYMVEIKEKINQIVGMVEKGAYFTINRPRQYGKTTTLLGIYKVITKMDGYICLKMSFEGLGVEVYQSSDTFIRNFIELLQDEFIREGFQDLADFIEKFGKVPEIKQLSRLITGLVKLSQKKIALIIDEVDKSMNNQLFLDFLGMLRTKYLDRTEGRDVTFHSVILAGVHDVKTMKLKIRPDSEQKYNSPWNIATDFNVDLSFRPGEIATMLIDYCNDKKIEMDIDAISKRIYHYTSGYPFLVSRICKEIDEKILIYDEKKSWHINDVDMAVKTITNETNTNFESLIKNIENNETLFNLVENLIIGTRSFRFVFSEPTLYLAYIHGIINKEEYTDKVIIHNG